MRKAALSVLVLVLVGLLLVPGLASANVTKFTLWTFIPQHARFFQVMAEKWNELNPDRQVEIEATVLPYDDMHNKLQIALQSGVGARISAISRSAASQLFDGSSSADAAQRLLCTIP